VEAADVGEASHGWSGSPLKATVSKVSATEKAFSGISPSLGAVFIGDANASDSLSKLFRYEAGIESSLYPALRELEKV
jgi:hypothetical protein